MMAAIMQPTYLPWVGYFDLMDQSEVFVYLDSVQFNKRSWQQRNRILTHAGELMLTVPVFVKGKREQRIDEVEIDWTSRFEEKHQKAIELSYSKHSFFLEVAEVLFAQYKKKPPLLVDFNISIIEALANGMGLVARTQRASTMSQQGAKAELLVSICQKLGATEYLSALGSKEYIEDTPVFESAKIALRYHQYHPASYAQKHSQTFVPYLSALDLFMNVGFKKSLEVIRKGRTV